MATNIKLDQVVYVPRSLINLDSTTPAGPFLRTNIRDIKKRFVKVDLPGDVLSISNWVSISKVVLKIGILIIRIGDYDEAELIEPLCKSVFNYGRMLLPANAVQVIELRTLEELAYYWSSLHSQFEQVILIGHGDKNHIYFGEKGVTAKELASILEKPSPNPKEFISLCCQTAQGSFGKALSLSPSCSVFVAPFHSIHGVIASQFCQSYLTGRLLDGLTVGVSFNHARESLIGAASFRLWQNGRLKAGPK